MTQRIGCFHAHYTNIEHMERAFGPYDVELVHYVDPGLDRIKADADFTRELAQAKVQDTLDWISKCHADAILATCTFFTANMRRDTLLACPVPVVKIDEPLFQHICRSNEPFLVAFTNPATVEGTMEQLRRFAEERGSKLRAEAVLLENTFDLIMRGEKVRYTSSVTDGLQRIAAANPGKTVVAAQLSMVPAAEAAGVGNQLSFLAGYMEELPELKLKRVE